MSASSAAEPTGRIVAFLRGIGIEVIEGEVPQDSFLPGLRIAAGRLVYDPARLCWPGDLLHEAGHLAVMPAALRGLLDDRIEVPPEAEHAGEIEAMAWSYAAVRALELDPAVLFHQGGYRGHSEGLLLSFGLGVYPGSGGLQAAGMSLSPAQAAAAGTQPYPSMQRWLRA
ncbi:MAG TPA: hypothetical protein VNX47_06550 [Nevskia sp.]|nr:hypothetical protein [Nevskia sp.]